MDWLSLPFHEATGRVVYKAVFGGYDVVDPVGEDFSENVDSFVLFTDDMSMDVQGWSIVYVKDSSYSPVELNRFYKLMPHVCLPNSDVTLYIDGNISLTPVGISQVFDFAILKKFDFMNMKHFSRVSIFDEAEVLLRSDRVDPLRLVREIHDIYKQGFRSEIIMGENNVLFRKTKATKELGEMWFMKYLNGAGRDQISLPPILRDLNISFGVFPRNVRDTIGFKYSKHLFVSRQSINSKLGRYILFVLPYKAIRSVFRF